MSLPDVDFLFITGWVPLMSPLKYFSVSSRILNFYSRKEQCQVLGHTGIFSMHLDMYRVCCASMGRNCQGDACRALSQTNGTLASNPLTDGALDVRSSRH